MATHASSEAWGRFHTEPWWAHEHRELDYQHEPFNDPGTVDRWRQLGFTQQRFTGDLYDMRRAEPAMIDTWRTMLPIQHFSWSFYRMNPGDILPLHHDTYSAFRRIYNVASGRHIRRYIIFLESWQGGHYFEIDGTAVVDWRAGDVVYWHDDISHVAANIGQQPRYTLQITGLADPGARVQR